MSRTEIFERLSLIFRDVFDNEDIVLEEKTTANDIDEWDSLTHIMLIAEVESAFDVKFAMKDVVGFKNVGEMADVIAGGQ